MNSRQHSTMNLTQISGQFPWENLEGKTNQGEILLIELAEIFRDYNNNKFPENNDNTHLTLQAQYPPKKNAKLS
jgi:hypothetical protein